MALQAKITSVEAIESFRASLIVYLAKARPVLEEVTADVMRVRSWIEQDQRRHWENELRGRKRRLEEAQAELFSARLSQLTHATTLPHMAMKRAQRAVHEVEAKLTLLKKWERELENRSDPLTKQLEQIHGFLTTDMSRAVAHLAQLLKSLDAYAEVLAPARPDNSPPAPGNEPGNAAATTPTGSGENAPHA